jgi:hypothetical protein
VDALGSTLAAACLWVTAVVTAAALPPGGPPAADVEVPLLSVADPDGFRAPGADIVQVSLGTIDVPATTR